MFFRKPRIRTYPEGRSQLAGRRETFIVHHYCPHTYNIGDHFVIRSIRRHLKKFLPQVLFIPKPCAFNRGWGKPVRLTGENINFSNRFADAVIIGGSDQYNNWSLRIRRDEIPHLQPPLYLIGLGVSSKSLDAPPHIEKTSYFEDIRATHAAARLASVRDEFTNEFLKGIGVTGAVVTGCPAMYLFDEKFSLKPDGVAAMTFPFPVVRKNNREAYEKLIATIRELLRRVQQAGLRPVITCHDDRDVTVAQELFPQASIFFSNDIDEFIEFYQGATVVLGSRLHASIFAAGAGIPFINLNLDARGKGFTQTFGLTGWNLDIDAPDLVDAFAARLQQILAGDLSVFEKFYTRKARYMQVFVDFMQRVAGDIRGNYENQEGTS